MQLIGPYIFHANEFLPYNKSVTSWATAGSNHLITFDTTTNHFIIPNASYNDYLVTWYVVIKTATTSKYPIFGLEFLYGETYRCDYCIAPCKTLQLYNSAIYHIPSAAAPDILSIGLKAVGEPSDTYTINSECGCNITANINILGL